MKMMPEKSWLAFKHYKQRNIKMKLSELLYNKVIRLWKEAADKAFVRDMAKGTLDRDHFRYYMLQDYLYLQEYRKILKSTLGHTEDKDLQLFLQHIIEETEKETYRVHVPNMRQIGIRDKDITDSRMADVLVEYTAYMKKQAHEGLITGLTALLQCSWVYAYIGQVLREEYPDEINASPYRSWFDAYTCAEYVETNRRWIEALDRETENTASEERDRLCLIFEECARYENRFWDLLYAQTF